MILCLFMQELKTEKNHSIYHKLQSMKTVPILINDGEDLGLINFLSAL